VINLAARLFDVGAGSIRIDGQDVREVTLASLRQSIAIVSQELTLFDDTIRANIALGRLGASDADIVAAAEAAAAHEFIVAQPSGYDTVIGDSGLRLSGPCQGHPQGCADPAARRGHERARHRIGAPGAGGADPLHQEPHHACDRPPPLHGAARRRDLRDG
jgi:hypothetical protein